MTSISEEHVDVLVVGAGISGIGVARYLLTDQPGTTFVVLEGRAALGGTWDLFRYPGIRSDSDLYTFGYRFKPWTDAKSIAGADRILAYLYDTVQEYGIDRYIRYHHNVIAAAWSTADARWTVQVERSDTGEQLTLTANWVFGATGYYDYDAGYTPHFEGQERFRGPIVHPQHWPEDLDYTGKKVVVIGSGATAVTLAPTMADTGAEHVTVLQRTPTYVLPVPSVDKIASMLSRLLGAERGFAATRAKNIRMQRVIWSVCQRFPALARRLIRSANRRALPEGFDVDTHFNPPYNPWDQRLCSVPDGDFFRAIRDGRASVVTDRIRTFTENGILLDSGQEVEADLIVTATGLNLKLLGGIAISVDGEPLQARDHIVYRGMMLSGVPNLAFAIGYTNSSWTLKVDLLCEHFCAVLAYMQRYRYNLCVPEAPNMQTRPMLDFAAGYVQRALDKLPRQGDKFPWNMSMNYLDDARHMRRHPVTNEHLRFARVPVREEMSA
ncbi:flavin-containing monooxygenase [Nocardia amikacinitolerans]|uniref:flavin-containing monooxygenase n=1 Tax=Nocardia amikacinitolerans TaxID=756689 RepID=UPI00082B30C9|nr:NAD(P)/FAD-dependent oxidoreductase [Nocardia amikacinitolerans]MCP2281002.1 putative flavoprotein CzcO associated with the cation diffusion facilitator CzcD [Nocardia amikacinitolerans]MCP2320162.1 putative flavoprotein CzcO associated with the cation diffusion facilitator CzcD [Nocardia amikacinitolerans]